MAPRVGFSLERLRDMDVGACKSDARLVWRDGDRMNIGIVQPRLREDSPIYFLNVCVGSTRELRLLAAQMVAHAENLERVEDQTEVVIP